MADKIGKTGKILKKTDRNQYRKEYKGKIKRQYNHNKPSLRDYNDPVYKEARLKCYQRDNFKCRHCGSSKYIQAHHILSWAEYPALRFNFENLITLCDKCHKMVKGKEDYYIKYFHTILLNDLKKEAKEAEKGKKE